MPHFLVHFVLMILLQMIFQLRPYERKHILENVIGFQADDLVGKV